MRRSRFSMPSRKQQQRSATSPNPGPRSVSAVATRSRAACAPPPGPSLRPVSNAPLSRPVRNLSQFCATRGPICASSKSSRNRSPAATRSRGRNGWPSLSLRRANPDSGLSAMLERMLRSNPSSITSRSPMSRCCRPNSVCASAKPPARFSASAISRFNAARPTLEMWYFATRALVSAQDIHSFSAIACAISRSTTASRCGLPSGPSRTTTPISISRATAKTAPVSTNRRNTRNPSRSMRKSLSGPSSPIGATV